MTSVLLNPQDTNPNPKPKPKPNSKPNTKPNTKLNPNPKRKFQPSRFSKEHGHHPRGRSAS